MQILEFLAMEKRDKLIKKILTLMKNNEDGVIFVRKRNKRRVSCRNVFAFREKCQKRIEGRTSAIPQDI